MKTLKIKSIKQLLPGSVDRETGRQRQFIPIPLRCKEGCPNWAFDYASSQCGEGKQLEYDEVKEGGRYLLLIEDGHGTSKAPPGDWIIEYAYTRNDGIHEANLFLAAEVQ